MRDRLLKCVEDLTSAWVSFSDDEHDSYVDDVEGRQKLRTRINQAMWKLCHLKEQTAAKKGAGR